MNKSTVSIQWQLAYSFTFICYLCSPPQGNPRFFQFNWGWYRWCKLWDGVWGMVQYFGNWRSLRKQQKWEGDSNLPCPSPLKRVIKHLRERCLSLEERSILISEDRGTQSRIWVNRPCQVSPIFLPLPDALWPILFLYNPPLIVQLSIKILRFNHFFGSSFSCEGSQGK